MEFERGETVERIIEHVIEAWMPATGTLGPFELRSGAHPGD